MRELIELVFAGKESALLVREILGAQDYVQVGGLEFFVDYKNGVSSVNCNTIHFTIRDFNRCPRCAGVLCEYEAQHESHSHAADDLRG